MNNKTLSTFLVTALALGMTSIVVAQPAATESNVNGGDVTETNISKSAETSTWAGFYGSVSENRTLSDGSDTMFQWTSEDASGSVIYALPSTNTNTPSGASLAAVTTDAGADAVTDTSGIDAASNTYSGTQATPSTGSVSGLSDTYAVKTLDGTNGDSSFTSYLANDTAPSSDEPVFFGDVGNNAQGFDGNLYDYQLLATTGDGMSGKTFDFYLEVT